MIALFSNMPKFCPNCGRTPVATDKVDFFGGASHTCPKCGLVFQFVTEISLYTHAARVGDIAQHYSPTNTGGITPTR